MRHSSSQFAKPQKSIVFDKDISEDKEVKDHEQIPFNPSKGSKHSHKNPANIPLEKSEYDGHSNHDDSLNENTASEVESVEEITAENAKIARQANPSREELALFDEMIACVQQRNYLDCYDLATTATETFIDRSRLGTAYFVQFISAYNIDKSDASLDLFFVVQELQNLGQIHIDPLYEAQAYRSALHLTVILNNKLNYYALRDLAITHTESYAEYAEQVDDIIKSADAKSWTSQ